MLENFRTNVLKSLLGVKWLRDVTGQMYLIYACTHTNYAHYS